MAVRMITGGLSMAETLRMLMAGPVTRSLLMPLESLTLMVGVAVREPVTAAAG